MAAELVLHLKNDLSEIERMSRSIEEFAERNQLPMKALYDLNLILEELVVNVISYGYEDSAEHVIELRVELKDRQLIIELQDDGRPFNPLEVPAPDTDKPLEERPIGGLGIHLVRKLTQEIRYSRRNEKNCLWMTLQAEA